MIHQIDSVVFLKSPIGHLNTGEQASTLQVLHVNQSFKPYKRFEATK